MISDKICVFLLLYRKCITYDSALVASSVVDGGKEETCANVVKVNPLSVAKF